ncbi:peptidoglycan-binding protein [Nocardioides convexus]|uniref:peptidoglycan-binding domain-containing protein n=1 Tax=Nocardioides convexus TaxID=2712224 RepID=UPI002418B699|nr:peptidoglycan-binding protein [Nocardioides convexus]
MNTKTRLARRITLVTVVAALLSVLAYGVGWAVREDALPWQDSSPTAAPRQHRPAPAPSTSTPAATPSQDGTPSPSEEPSETPGDQPSATPSETPSGTPDATPSEVPSATRSAKPTPTAGPALLSPATTARGSASLQARLKQIAWFSGDVTDHYGAVTAEAVRGFQAKRQIAVTGAVDQRTLDLLHKMTRQPTQGEA